MAVSVSVLVHALFLFKELRRLGFEENDKLSRTPEETIFHGEGGEVIYKTTTFVVLRWKRG